MNVQGGALGLYVAHIITIYLYQFIWIVCIELRQSDTQISIQHFFFDVIFSNGHNILKYTIYSIQINVQAIFGEKKLNINK